MASNHTEHFSLNQWLPDDQVKHTDFNEDNAQIDIVLGKLGNCQIETGTYIGTGHTNGHTLTFSQTPLVVLIQAQSRGDTGFFMQGCATGISITEPNYETAKVTALVASWSDSSFTFRAGYSSTTARGQLLESGTKYTYSALIAIGS